MRRPARRRPAAAAASCGCADPITSNLYDASETDGLPDAAVAASLGCGNPTALVDARSRARPCSTSARAAASTCCSRRGASGPTGKVYGLDMTDEMLALARENQRKAGVDQRRVPEGRDRAHPAARQLGRRHHLELRHQPLGRQGRGAARGVPRAQARRPLRRLRRRRARRGAGRHPPQRGAVGRLRRRRARRNRSTRDCSATAGFDGRRRSSRGASTTWTTRATS